MCLANTAAETQLSPGTVVALIESSTVEGELRLQQQWIVLEKLQLDMLTMLA